MNNLNILIIVLVWVVASYLLGAIPFGLLIGKLKGIDIRTLGSGNIGATNVYRTVGKGWGLLAFFCDFMKGLLPIILIYSLMRSYPSYLPVLAGMSAVIGHLCPVWLKFKGGKGVATGFGMMIGLTPYLVLSAFGVFVIVVLISRYISLGSILAALFLAITVWPIHYFGCFGWYESNLLLSILLTLVAVFSIWKHRSNIERLLKGTENKFF